MECNIKRTVDSATCFSALEFRNILEIFLCTAELWGELMVILFDQESHTFKNKTTNIMIIYVSCHMFLVQTVVVWLQYV